MKKKWLILDVLNVIFNAEFKNPNKNDVTVPFLKKLEFMICTKYQNLLSEIITPNLN